MKKAVLVIAGIFLVLVGFLVRCFRFGEAVPRSQVVVPANGCLGIDLVQKLGKATSDKAPIAFVRFTTAFGPMQIATGARPLNAFGDKSPFGRKGAPLTELWSPLGSDVKAWFHLEGTFETAERLSGEFSPCKHVKRSVPVETRWGGDATFKRLSAFGSVAATDGSVLLMAVGTADDFELMDADFFGPFVEHEVPLVRELVQTLKRQPFNAISTMQAERFLGSANAWIAWLGLARLASLGVLTHDHFLAVLERRPDEDVANIMVEMSMSLAHLGLDEEKRAVMRAMKQESVLKYLVKNPDYVRKRGLQDAAKVNRDLLRTQAKNAQMVKLLDSIANVER